jgi:EpsI family protein
MMFQPRRMKWVVLAASLVVMLGSVVVAEQIKPRTYWADHTGEPHYEKLVPEQFGEWKAWPYVATAVVNPVQEASLNRIYSQTYSRAFVHQPTGRVIMLSIAYGRDQSNDTQLHTPEQCYPSQGFRVNKREDTDLNTPFGVLKAVRLETTMGAERSEPLTFFIRVGNAVARGSKERNLERIKMATRGFLVDGTLIRVSEITRSEDAFELQAQFVNALLQALPANDRGYFIGQRDL